jgi:energy-coupling factor transporter ATP-binding protein EcfA2
MELPLRGTFLPLGYSIEIMTNSPAVLAAATESFGHMRSSRDDTRLQIRVGVSGRGSSACPPEPTRREFDHLYSLVADVNNQALLDLETGTNFTWLTQAAVDNSLYFRSNFLEKTVYLLLGATVVTDIHAACVSKNGKGILLCGETGAGKSTLAYACARAGWTYTSDDTSYLINDADTPRVIGHSHRVRFRPSARQLFPELEGYAVTPRMEGKPSIEVPIVELPVPHMAAEAEVHSIVYLRRHPSSSGKLVRLPNGTASRRAGDELYSAGQIRAKHVKNLEVLREVPTYELEYYDLDAAIETLESLTSETRETVAKFARPS